MKGNQRQTKRAHCQSSDALSDVSCLDVSLSDVCCLGDDDNSLASMCTCGAEGRAHKRGCPMSSRKRYPGRTLFLLAGSYSASGSTLFSSAPFLTEHAQLVPNRPRDRFSRVRTTIAVSSCFSEIGEQL